MQAHVPSVHHPRIHYIVQRDHLIDKILGDITNGPIRMEDTLGDVDWVMTTQEELNNFTRNGVWSLVKRHKYNVIGTNWVFLN
uniref:OSJNBa0022F16.27 protein n=2 Tax=Oryza sativa subsp. japonica TaxID=39947 RepID=A0A5S6RCL1_ORYSJ|nr:OSJNBa0022F16.27 [Oryza sativa Japonica Group]CAE05574.3 OSJNBa0032N05.2 [Oryza sativa Japonica Group]